MFSRDLILVLLFSECCLLLATSAQGQDELDSYDELDTYEEGDGAVSAADIQECLRTEHKGTWHIRWSDELAAKVQQNLNKWIHVSYYSKNWKGKFDGLEAVVYKVHGTNNQPSSYVCKDFRYLKYDKIREISVRDGAAETGCGMKLSGNSVTVLCLYRTKIDGYVPVVRWDK
ncbi:uncharacterized protein LOC134820580 [Bolinopsis microptera]|uniref:uncharacterized protein LOC134820580 n=1 Tax=Bolinopsis microptera TaxID=2820187 RepID=UPI00307A7A7A